MDHPDDLKFTVWDKKKGSLAAGGELAGLLKALQDRHAGVKWTFFDPAWAKAAKSADELQEAFALRDRQARSSLFALKKAANEVALAAAQVARDKKAARPVLDAAKSIGAAAKVYAGSVDAFIDGLKAAHDKALAALPADEPASVLLDPKQLLKGLNACRRDPQRRLQFGYVDGKDKQPAVLAVSARMSARKVFITLQAETGVKTGAYGTAWVDDISLMLKVDKPLGGLVKKVRPLLRAAGFRIAKVVLWRDDGSLFEQDEDAGDAAAAAAATDAAEGSAEAAEAAADAADTADAADAAGAGAVAGAGQAGQAGQAAEALAATGPEAPIVAVTSDAEAAFTARLKTVLAALTSAGLATGPMRLKVSEAGALARQRNWAMADSTLRQVEALLAGAAPAGPVMGINPPAGPVIGSETPAGPAVSTAPPGRFVHQAKVRLGWQKSRLKLAADLKALQAAILDHYRGQPELADLATRVRRFDGVLGTLDESLVDKLDEALNATDPARRSALHDEARTILAGYAAYVRDEPLIAALDDNPFLPLSTHRTLLATLQVLDKSLA